MCDTSSLDEWARVQRGLLRLENDAEKMQVADAIAQLSAQECMERGISLVPLAVQSVTTGLYGRACLSVGDPKGRPLPAHRLGAGDQVRLHSTKGSNNTDGRAGILGVIGKVTELTVEVISDDADDGGTLRYPLRLDVVASEATHKKLMLGLDALEKYPGGGPSERVINVLFGLESPSAAGSTTGALSSHAPSAATANLNDSQREAIAFALSTRDVALIHGPPGTGKTTTVVALVLEAVARGWRCLVCAPSNVAVDGILERLVATEDGSNAGTGNRRRRPRVVRMGHPARLLPKVLEHSLDGLVSRHEGTAIVNDVRGEINALVSQLYGNRDNGGGSKATNRGRAGDRKSAKREVKALRKEARFREDKVVREILKSRDVVLATCIGAATYSLRDETFDLVVIDEAAQALEAACWIPILKGSRLVLAGDHKQLAPTVKSQDAEAGLLDGDRRDSHGSNGGDGLGFTMFDRILRDHGPQVCRMLEVQYRMNENICGWASKEMYGGFLRAHPSVATRTLTGLPHASNAEDMAAAVMLLIDTTGCDMHEEETGGGSRRNEREAEVAVQHVVNLLEAGVLESEVAVISPYNGQVNLLKRLLRPRYAGVEVRSVDGFQGGEKEAIVLSLVRSNPGKKVGFLADTRRLNVAVTRAKRHVAVVCDMECCGSDAFIARLLQHIVNEGEYRSALELNPGPEVTSAATEVDIEPVVASITDQGTSPLAVVKDSNNDVPSEASADQKVGEKKETAEPAKENDNEEDLQCADDQSQRSALVQIFADDDVLARVHAFAEVLTPAAGGGGGEMEVQGVASEGDTLALPAELTARQRALVHETAETLGLGHVSRGEGPLRRAILSRVVGVDAQRRNAEVDARQLPRIASIDRSDRSTCVETVVNFDLATATGFMALGTEDEDSDATDSGVSGLPEEPTAAAVNKASNSCSSAPVQHEGSDSPPDPNIRVECTSPAILSSATAAAASRDTAGRFLPTENALLKDLHAARAARRPPPPPAQAKGRQKKGKSAASTAGDQGFAVELASANGGGRGGAKKKSASKRGGSAKKGKNKGGGGWGGGEAFGNGGAKVNNTSASEVGGGGGDSDDEMAFLDAQIKTQRASEPCYAALLRSTTEAMRAKNPAWAKAQDKEKPSKSTITNARRGQLEGALQTRLEEENKKRSKSAGNTEKNSR